MQRKLTFIISMGLLSTTSFVYAGSPGTPFTGFYVGLNGGANQLYGTSNSSVTANEIHVIGFDPNEVQSLNNSQHGSLNSNSLLGGINFGYGYQFCMYNLYLGAEVFLTVAQRNDSMYSQTSFTDVNPVDVGPAFDVINLSSNTKTSLNNFEWGVDVRPGVLVNANTLVYARFGVAFNRMTVNNSNQLSVTYPFGGLTTPLTSTLGSSQNKNVAGYRLGVGVEEYICGNWAVSADYVYTNYGSVNTHRVGNVNSATVPLDEDFAPPADTIFLSTPGAFSSSAKSTLYNQQIFLGLKYYF